MHLGSLVQQAIVLGSASLQAQRKGISCTLSLAQAL